MTPPLTWFLLLSAALFSVGTYGLLTRRNAIAILLSIEIMANAVNINLVAFSRCLGDLAGQVFTLFAISLTVAEVVIGLAIVVLLYRDRDDVRADLADRMRG
ncbi:MAG: NADH-quinone oxidoreductase subunit NuoK [Deltaproteobacteria bacterium]|nr:NADH-quinone oxidoreductase subunit NuoK [Deltaproteobacteria bacterium]